MSGGGIGEPWGSWNLEGRVGEGGAVSGRSCRRALKGTEGTCVAGGAGPSSGREGALPSRRRPPKERERGSLSGLGRS